MRGNTVTIEMPMQRGKVGKTIPLYQYDYGQKLIITGIELPSYYEVHFSNELHGEAVTSIGDESGVDIPDAVLTSGSPIYLWLYLHETGSDGETEFQGTIPVIKRASISDVEPTPAQQNVIEQAIAALNAGVAEVEEAVEGIEDTINSALEEAKESGEFDGVSPTVEMTPIENGYQISITDASGTSTASIMNGEEGAPGEDGDDGFSPTASVSKSGSVATISITDKNGTTSVQVNDGDTGATPDFTIGTVTTGEPGTDASATITGTAEFPELNLTIPQGADGDATVDDTAGDGDTTHVWSADKLVDEFGGKADKVESATSGNFAGLDSNGNLVDSGHKHSDYVTDVSGKADKVSSATNGNFAGLDSNGNLVDSGHKHSDYVTDVSGKADKWNPAFTGSVSMGRTSGYAVGTKSTALGEEVIANGDDSLVFGKYNKPDTYAYWDEWEPNTGYIIGDKVCVATTQQGSTVYKGYRCIEDHVSGSTFDGVTHWRELSGTIACVEIVGNGTAYSRSNARVLDWDGNEKLKGWLYVNCNDDSSGGKIVATQELVNVKANKVNNATDGNFAGLNSSGNLTDSGYKPSDFLTEHQDISGKADIIVDTASGAIATFPDGANNLPVKSLVAQINPVQSGTGDPSPDNVRPITGWSGANLCRTGKNLLSGVSLGSIDQTTGQETTGSNGITDYIRVKNEETYTLSPFATSALALRVFKYGANKAYIGTFVINSSTGSFQIAVPSDTYYIRLQASSSVLTTTGQFMLAEGSSASAYEAYQSETYSISWQSTAGTVYGGSLRVNEDGSGVLTADKEIFDLGSTSWTYNSQNAVLQGDVPPDGKSGESGDPTNMICSCYKAMPYGNNSSYSGQDAVIWLHTNGKIRVRDSRYTDPTAYGTAITGQKIVYPISTPVTYNLTALEVIETLKGLNNIWSNTGNVTVEYPADTKLYIDKKIAELQALILES